jgi:hypothetical protein
MTPDQNYLPEYKEAVSDTRKLADVLFSRVVSHFHGRDARATFELRLAFAGPHYSILISNPVRANRISQDFITRQR